MEEIFFSKGHFGTKLIPLRDQPGEKHLRPVTEKAPTGESGSHFSVHPLYNLTFPTPLSTVRWSRL